MASSHKLAAALAQRLNNIVPAPFHLSADNGHVNIHNADVLDTICYTPDIVEDESRDLTDLLETVTLSVLSSVQDIISEETRDAWPSTDGRTMALPGARIDAEAVHLWYGEEESPLVRLPPIRLDEIMEGRA